MSRSDVRLLYVSTIYRFLQDFLLPYGEFFRERGWVVDAMAAGAPANAACRAAFSNTWDVSLSRSMLDPRNMIVAPAEIMARVRAGRYDIVHVHTPIAAFAARYALRRARRQDGFSVIYTAHGFHAHPENHVVANTLFQGLERVAGRWTDELVVINEHDAELARAARLVSPDRLHHMHGIGVDPDLYSRDRVSPAEVEQIRAELGLSPGDTLMVMVAEFSPDKRHADVLYALQRARNQRIHLACAGEGPLLGQVRELTERLGLADRVHFLGWRWDIPALFASASATVLASRREGLPRSIMESLALETPVIASRVRGNEDLLRHGGGLLVPLGDVDAFAAGMDWVLEHPEEARKLGKGGREMVERQHGLSSILEEHVELYENALRRVRRSSV